MQKSGQTGYPFHFSYRDFALSITATLSTLQEECSYLSHLVVQLAEAVSLADRIILLEQQPRTREWLAINPSMRGLIEQLSESECYLLYAVAALGQAERLCCCDEVEVDLPALRRLCSRLDEVDHFYAELGGLIGYQLEALKVQLPKMEGSCRSIRYLRPQGIDISEPTYEVRQAILSGIEQMGQMCEIYPVGGAADRLSLTDECTGMALPAARLLFRGRTLLKGMILDLQAREYLHYKLLGQQLITPVAMMTSGEKGNHQQILMLCEEEDWFGRPQTLFRFFRQPSVPTMNRAGEWALSGPADLLLKPGGHGVIWKLARDQAIFSWLTGLGRKKALVRQINNPLAGTDYGLLAFVGIGCAGNKRFGFASCPRQVRASEGMNVLIEREGEEQNHYLLTSIEYCDFAKFGIADESEAPGSPYSKFPSNTNILFADLAAVERAVEKMPIPGRLINFKRLPVYRGGTLQREEVGRLESTMQNIADLFIEEHPERPQDLKTFLTYNHRKKTISTTKREMSLGTTLLETPEGCFLDALENARDLLTGACGMQLPQIEPLSEVVLKGPPFLFNFHPALGPLYSIIGQKLRGGRLGRGSELQLELADLDVEDLDLEGSLLIIADQPMGHLDRSRLLHYSNRTGKCTLKRVKVRNSGIEEAARNLFWKHEIYRKESCTIILRGHAELEAEDLELVGPWHIEVPDGMKMVIRQIEGKPRLELSPLSAPSWQWHYRVDEGSAILLEKRRGDA